MECKHLSTQLKALHPQRCPFADKILCPALHSPLKDPWTQLTLTCLLHLLGVLAPPWDAPSRLRLGKPYLSPRHFFLQPICPWGPQTPSVGVVSSAASQSLRRCCIWTHPDPWVRILKTSGGQSMLLRVWKHWCDHPPRVTNPQLSAPVFLAAEKQPSASPSLCP